MVYASPTARRINHPTGSWAVEARWWMDQRALARDVPMVRGLLAPRQNEVFALNYLIYQTQGVGAKLFLKAFQM